jgi:hypothetical protein
MTALWKVLKLVDGVLATDARLVLSFKEEQIGRWEHD